MRSSKLLSRLFLSALVAAAAGLFGSQADAQGFGAPVLSIATTSAPQKIFVGDFDGDGHQDLLYLTNDPTAPAGSEYLEMSIAFGDGAGNFAAPVAQGGVNASSLAVTVADFDGDGIDDFAFAIGPVGGARQSIYEVWFGTKQRMIRNGPVNIWLPSGNFAPNYTNLAAISLDETNTKGFVLLDQANKQGTVLHSPPGEQAGTETPEYIFALSNGAGLMVATDVNGDGIADLVVLGLAGNTVDVFLGTGQDPVFGSSVHFGGSTNVQSMLVQDMNHDGIPDLGLENATGQIQVFAGNGDGTFQLSPIGGTMSTDDSAGDGGHLIAAADVNGDGILDLLTYTPLGISVELGSASGNYTLQGVYPAGTSAGANGQFVTGDFNGDGALDVALDAPGGIEILYGNASPATGNTLTATPEPSSYGSAFTLTATLAPGAGGTVQFAIDATSLGSSNVQQNGIATWPVAAGNTLAVGTHAITGTWLASGHALAVQITGSHTITPAARTPTGTLNGGGSTAFEAPIAVSVTVGTANGSAAPTGTVTFTIAGATAPLTSGAIAITNGTASYIFPAVPPNTGGNPVLPGSNTVTAVYSGDTNYGAATFTAMHVVNLGVTSVTLAPAPPTPALAATYFYGQPINGYVNFTAQDSQFALTGSWEQLSNGVGVPGCTVLSITGSSCPYGYPTIIDAGNYVWVEQYNGGPANGDSINGTGDSTPYAFTVMPDTTTASSLTSSLNPAPVGTAVTFTVTLTGNAAVPAGVVQFLDGSNFLGTGTLGATGQASLMTSSLRVGTHPITAVYAATLDFNGVTSSVLNQVIQAVPLASAVTLISSVNPSLVGQPVTFTAAASVPGPFPFLIQSGTMTFLDGATQIGTGAINQFGRATVTTSTLAVGSHAITASYPGGMSPGGQPIAASVSAVLTQVVGAGLRNAPTGFSLTVTPNPVTLKPGSTGVLLVTVQAISGFSQAVALSCTGTNSSNELGCSFVESTIPIGGGATTLYLATTAPYACGGSSTQPYLKHDEAALVPGCGLGTSRGKKVWASGWQVLGFGGAMVAGLAWVCPRRRRRWQRLLALVIMAGLVGLSGCGNCTNLGTKPGTYDITVLATAGTVTQSVVVTVDVLNP